MFQHCTVQCGDDYIMAPFTWHWEKMLRHLERTDCYVSDIVFKPTHSQIRITITPKNLHAAEVINVESAPVTFLRNIWDVGINELNNAIKAYILQSDIKAQFVEGQRQRTSDGRYEYTPMPEEERTWLMTTILGSRHD